MCRTPVPKSDEEIFHRVFQKATVEKRPWAMEQLADCYSRGEGTAKNVKKAFEFYINASELGQTYALNWVGVMYEKGEGVTQSN